MWQCKSWIIDETTIPFNTGVTRWQNSENSVCYTWSLLLLNKLSTFPAIEFSLLLLCTIGTITLHQMWCNSDLFVMAFYQYKKSTQLHTTFFLNILLFVKTSICFQKQKNYKNKKNPKHGPSLFLLTQRVNKWLTSNNSEYYLYSI